MFRYGGVFCSVMVVFVLCECEFEVGCLWILKFGVNLIM